ncbi:FUSC family protein [Streptomyces sp. Je 1-79]|uniref:FUSC family protein n=1 Tax=Streptomyces sp. Je 1-79 TaxID=2943847 RepID=UPI0021A70AF1|nr:FUSC family protein [Streptomyces sp. Je 1-79]MCT4352056.1 FUSC family protein [Streptomyces sp. Je 1-79]
MGRLPRVRLPAAYAAAARRSVRVTLAASAGFYLFLYGFDSAVAATYALFAAVSMAGLSHIPGTGRQRAAVLLPSVPACWVLVTIGTYLSVRTWSAALGMLVVGFVLAFIAAGGPRTAGAAPGLQLMYILPSFPPYDPGSLGERLVGATVGLALLILAEAFLLPDRPPTVSYRELAARAADCAERCADALASPPYVLSDAPVLTAARAAGKALRSSRVPEAERPAGPGLRDRALAQTGLGARTLLARLALLPPMPGGPASEHAGLDALRAVRACSAETAARLRGRAPTTGAHAELWRVRQALATAPEEDTAPAVLRRHAAVLEVADAALAMSTAADLAVRGRAAAATAAAGRFWYAGMRAPALWWRRLTGHVGQRSVFFQNAVRISLALAAARTIAGIDTLPHGFWLLLATLSLTRTTARETRSTVRVALTGTLVGALVAATLLTLVGTDIEVYAAALPPLMLVTFALGPVKGVGWAQAMFTVVVALVFAQLAPATWQLAEFRLLDVLAGSAIGAVFGLFAWPRGAHDELRRSVATLLRHTAETVVDTTAQVADGGTRVPVVTAPGHRSLQHALIMAEAAYAQYQSEPRGLAVPSGTYDWQASLMAGHHALWGADRLLVPPEPAVVPPLDQEPTEALTRIGDRVAAGMLLVSARLDPSGDTPDTSVPLRARAFDDFSAEPPGAPRLYYATASWLDSLMTDLERITGEFAESRGRVGGATGPGTGRGGGPGEGSGPGTGRGGGSGSGGASVAP